MVILKGIKNSTYDVFANDVPITLIRNAFKILVLSVLTYGVDSNSDQNIGMQCKVERSMLGVRLRESKWRWAGRIRRFNEGRWIWNILEWRQRPDEVGRQRVGLTT